MRAIAFVVAIPLLFVFFIFLSCSRSVSKDQGTPPNAGISGEHFAPIEKAPVMVNSVSPEYPQGALEMEITGTVWLKVFVDNQVRLQLFALAYNLDNFLRKLALPKSVKERSLRTLREKLIKIGAKVIRHARYVTFQMAEVLVSRSLFYDILKRIGRLKPFPVSTG